MDWLVHGNPALIRHGMGMWEDKGYREAVEAELGPSTPPLVDGGDITSRTRLGKQGAQVGATGDLAIRFRPVAIRSSHPS